MPKPSHLGEILPSKRERKPKVIYSPETSNVQHRKGSHNQHKAENNRRGRPARSRNEAQDKTATNKWQLYLNAVKKATSFICRSMHYLEVLTGEKNISIDKIVPKASNGYGLESVVEGSVLTSSSSSSSTSQQNTLSERGKLEKKILQAKQLIMSTLLTIEEENQDDKQWHELEQEDEEGMVDINAIMCSKCLEEETEGNDILICDRKGCLRAYHQNCLDPPIKLPSESDRDQELLSPDHDWFCWRCECIDDCLDFIGERCGIEYDSVSELFPEMKAEKSGNTINEVLLDDEDEEDDDYEGEAELDDDEEDGEEDEEDEDAGLEGEEDGDEEDGDNEDEDNEDEDEGEYEDDDDSHIEEDEVMGLLEDANADANIAALTSSNANSRSLRPKRLTTSNSSTITLHQDERDVGVEVASVRRGVVNIGKVVSVDQRDDGTTTWTVVFYNGDEKEYDNIVILEQAIKLHQESVQNARPKTDSTLRNQIQVRLSLPFV